MRFLRRARLAAPLLALALGAAACGGGGGATSAGSTPSSAAAARPGGAFSVQLGEPENALVPGNTSESEGSQIVSALWTGLTTYDVNTSQQRMDGVAESITSPDATTWTVKLKPGWTFHDGTPVDARSFVDAWNYTALSTNAYGGSYFFSDIQGYEDLQAPKNAAGKVTGKPKAEEMSGLKVVDPQTFTVTLAKPFAQWPIKTGYNTFYPLPKAFFADPEAFGKKPIGNGPFKADTAFVKGQGITLSRFDAYPGQKAKADKVEFRIFADFATAYTEARADNLDVTEVIPDAITTFKTDFPDRFVERPSSSFTYIGFPTYDERFKDKRVRQAISMAIDRKAISDAIFSGTRVPAYSAISPAVAGSRPDACQYCKYDVPRAKQLLAESGFDTSRPVDLWFNSGAGHDKWMQAVGNQLRQNLGVDYRLQGGLDFASYLPKGDEKGFTGPFRLGWVMDYPSPQNYLEPLYSTAALPPAGSNSSFYSNPAFDALLAEGNKATNSDEAVRKYQQAEDLLLEDMPIAPMFFAVEQRVFSSKVQNVTVDAFGRIDLPNVTVRQ